MTTPEDSGLRASSDVQLVLAAGAELAEGPFWRNDELIWIDAPNGELHRTNTTSGQDKVDRFDIEFGVVIPTHESTVYFAATENGFAVVKGGEVVIADPIATSPDLFMNDGKCDARGRFWASVNRRDLHQGGGSLYLWEEGRSSLRVEEGFTLLNGIGWSPDNTTMYVVDSVRRTLFAYDYNLEHAAATGRRILCQFEESDGLPDGLAVDEEGCVWLAFYSGWQIRRISAAGATLEQIQMPVSRPTSCAFGNGTDLYITSAQEGLTPADLRKEPLAGSIWRIDVGVGGTPVSYAGGSS
jgi:sugar lactone lactonase YvrE